MNEETYCCCQALADLAVIPMGGNGLDALVFASFKRIEEHGGDQWWLNISTCRVCGQDWMVAQDERIYDNFYLRRLTKEIKQDIVEWSLWPEEFLTYERVLKLGRATGRVWTFYDSGSPALVTTAEDLRRERPDISFEEIAYLLGISAPHAASLLG
jgi:hypothetical protein